jgi:hypothetical protein
LEATSHAHAHGSAHLASVLLPVVLVHVSTVLIVVVVAAAAVEIATILLECSLLATNILRPVLVVISGVSATAIGFFRSVVRIDGRVVSNVSTALARGFGEGRDMVLYISRSFGTTELDVTGTMILMSATFTLCW